MKKTDRIKELEVENEFVTSLCDTYCKIIDSRGKENRELKCKLSNCELGIGEYSQSITSGNELEKRNEHLNEQKISLNNEIYLLKRNIETLKSEKESLQTTIKIRGNAYDKLYETQKATKAVNSLQSDSIKELKSEIETLKSKPTGFITSDAELKFTPFDKTLNQLKDLSEAGIKSAKAGEKIRNKINEASDALILDNIRNNFETQKELRQTQIAFSIFATIIIIHEIIKYFL